MRSQVPLLWLFEGCDTFRHFRRVPGDYGEHADALGMSFVVTFPETPIDRPLLAFVIWIIELARPPPSWLEKSSWLDPGRAGLKSRAGSTPVELAR